MTKLSFNKKGLEDEKHEISANLIKEIRKIPTIDCHEHLGLESERTNMKIDVFTLFQHYAVYDLMRAGMREIEVEMVFRKDLPVMVKWDIFEKYYKMTKYTSYSRAGQIVAKDLFGYDEINKDTAKPISDAMQEGNKPGIMKKILIEKCGFEAIVTQKQGDFTIDLPQMHPTYYIMLDQYTMHLQRFKDFVKIPINSLDDLLSGYYNNIVYAKEKGTVALKIISTANGIPNRKKAIKAFNALRDGKVKRYVGQNPLKDYLLEQVVTWAGELDMAIYE